MAAAPSPSKKIGYFGHFPHYFIKPYGSQIRINSNAELLTKLNVKNSEWLVRPNIALSECCQSIVDNSIIIQESDLLSQDVKLRLEGKIRPIQQSLMNLNGNDKTTTGNPQDIFNVMSFAMDSDDDFDNFLAELMHSSSAVYIQVMQMRAMRAVMTNLDTYASKLISDHPTASAFKSQKTVPALQTMLNSMCIAVPTPLPTANRNLMGQLVNPNIGATVQAVTAPVLSVGLPRPQRPEPSSLLVPPTATLPLQPLENVRPPLDQNTAIMNMLLTMQQELADLKRGKTNESGRQEKEDEDQTVTPKKKTRGSARRTGWHS